MRGVTKASVVAAVGALLMAPVSARADGFVTPWVGINFVNENDEGAKTFGVTTGYMGAGVFGFEADFGYSPDFLGLTSGFTSNSAVTLTGDAILGIPIGGTHGAGVRPFVSGGFGLLRTHSEREGLAIDLSRASNEFCYDLGVGMMGFFTDHIGLRGDLRYLRTLNDTHFGSGINLDPGRLHFWRFSGGITFR
jgi:outer membrane protein with beta-barrel domain